MLSPKKIMSSKWGNMKDGILEVSISDIPEFLKFLKTGIEIDDVCAKWCSCKNPDFNGDYIDARCLKCKGKIE